MNSIFLFLQTYVALIALMKVKAVQSDEVPYPFSPPSKEFCHHNSLGSDVYVSVFSPCKFVFYTGVINGRNATSSSCDGVLNNTEEKIIASEERKVIGWPDSCVANGPRCYDLSEYSHLNNFTLFSGEMVGFSNYYALSFPDLANYVSVDCTKDYQLAETAMKNLPETLEPIAQAIAFFAFMILIGILVCIGICCACLCNEGTRNRGGYTTVRNGVYTGPPVEAVKMAV